MREPRKKKGRKLNYDRYLSAGRKMIGTPFLNFTKEVEGS